MTGAEQDDQGEQPLRIMLLGKSGVGKSLSGNTILGRKVFKSDMKLKRATKYCEKESGTVKDVPSMLPLHTFTFTFYSAAARRKLESTDMIVGNLVENSPDVMTGAEQDDQGEQPLRIMLLGKSGVGKSSSGNTILGRKVFKSDMKLKRVTKYCEKESGTVKDVPVAVTGKGKDVPVSVIDTPGLFETDRNKELIVRDILKCVKLQEPGPHVFVLVVPVGRMTQEDQDTNTLIEVMFGPRVWDYTIVLFTHGDRLDGKTINDVITESEDNLRNFMRKCSGGFHVFNNKKPEDPNQVTSFLAKIQTLVALNGGNHYQNAQYPKQERKIREKQESILAERNAEISGRETQLQEHFQGQELVKKKRELWRKEEDRSREAAESYIRRTSHIWKFIFFLGGIVLVGLALGEPVVWLPAVIVILIVIFFKKSILHQFISGNIPWLSKKIQ